MCMCLFAYVRLYSTHFFRMIGVVILLKTTCCTLKQCRKAEVASVYRAHATADNSMSVLI